MGVRTKILGGGGAAAALVALLITTVMNFEGRELRAYQDIVGVWTICDGDTNNVSPGDVATPAECDKRTYDGLLKYEAGLDRCLVVAVPPITKIAFISWTYNVGIGAACGSTLVRIANQNRLVEACDQLLKWNRAGGRVVAGLTKRREAERVMCRQGLGLAA